MTVNPERGAFIAYEPGGYPNESQRVVVPFRFNPENLSRSLSIEQGRPQAGTQTSGGSGGEASTEQGADASSGTLKESFTIAVRFDVAHRLGSVQSLPQELGVAPEVAALESLLMPVPPASQDASDGSEPQQQRPRRRTVLFIWGRRRVLPVRITGMNILESLASPTLDPTRAEVEVSMEVLGDTDAADNRAVGDALAFTADKRRELADQFFEATASQGSNILPL